MEAREELAPERSRTVVTRVEDRKIDGRFPGLGRKTRGRIPAGIRAECLRSSEDRWQDRKVCVEAKQSHEGGVSIQCFYKKLDHFVPTWACIIVTSVGIF